LVKQLEENTKMRGYLEQLKYTGLLLWLRFLAVFLFTIFALLALGTSLMDVAEAYFSTTLQPLEALVYIAVVHLVIFGFFVAFNPFPIVKNPIEAAFIVWLCAIMLASFGIANLREAIFFYGQHPYHDVTQAAESMEHSARRVVLGLIAVEALCTALFDLANQWARTSETVDEEE
jgi:hypothetical protein